MVKSFFDVTKNIVERLSQTFKVQSNYKSFVEDFV